MLTTAACTHADRAERASMGVDGVSTHRCDCDPGSEEKDIDGDKVCVNLDDCDACLIVRASRRDASENLM